LTMRAAVNAILQMCGSLFISVAPCRIIRPVDKMRDVSWTRWMPEVPVCDREQAKDLVLCHSGCMPHWQGDFRIVSIAEIEQ